MVNKHASDKDVKSGESESLGVISDEGEDDQESEWNAEANALRQAIADGKYKGIDQTNEDVSTKEKVGNKNKNDKKEERVLGEIQVALEDDSSEDEEENTDEADKQRNEGNVKGLRSVTANLMVDKSRLPWSETFDVIPPTPLPFGREMEDGQTISVHDDLKREVSFYNMALEAVHDGRNKCADCNIPFSRPEDFFAEMVKTDDHMAMVKDRLIFENKKMAAFEQRKSNRELKLRAKESHAHRIVEKAKTKKKHMQDVDDWAKNAASNRAGGGRIRDDDDDAYLAKMGVGSNNKRQGMDRKYGHGGKSARFKQNDKTSLNDMSGYNPRGGSGGMGKSNGSGGKRKGKRARDASKSRH